MKKCGGCFRITEDWRDAKEKGLPPKISSCTSYVYRPRSGVRVHCVGVGNGERTITADSKTCKYYKARWAWNVHIWWRWHVVYKAARYRDKYIRVPLGALRKPVPLGWVDSYDFANDSIVPRGEPRCPHCGEMPYSCEQCVFCGQRFTTKDEGEVKSDDC